jgi:hypothetical protein
MTREHSPQRVVPSEAAVKQGSRHRQTDPEVADRAAGFLQAPRNRQLPALRGLADPAKPLVEVPDGHHCLDQKT